MKQEKYEFIQRISSHYVGDDCVQVMIPHYPNNGITILNSDGITYHYNPNSNLYINKYISDERKNNFPYSEIPIHHDRRLFKKFEFINQLLDFGRVYLKFADGMVVEEYALKDAHEALVARKYLLSSGKKEKIMTREEVETLILDINGGMFSLNGEYLRDFQLVSEETILEWYKEQVINRKEMQEKWGGSYNKEISKYFYQGINKLTINDLNEDILIDEFIGVYIKNNEIKSITGIVITFVGANRYKIEFYDFPITIYTIDHMKQLEQQNSINTREPRISKFLNPNIDKEIIRKEKEKVYSLIKNKR